MRSVHFFGEWFCTFQKLSSKKKSRWWNARAEHKKENLEKKLFFGKLIENFQLTLIRVTINPSNSQQNNFIKFIFWEWFCTFSKTKFENKLNRWWNHQHQKENSQKAIFGKLIKELLINKHSIIPITIYSQQNNHTKKNSIFNKNNKFHFIITLTTCSHSKVKFTIDNFLFNMRFSFVKQASCMSFLTLFINDRMIKTKNFRKPFVKNWNKITFQTKYVY